MGVTVERMLELGNEHEQTEFAHDWDATLATLVDHPVYHWFPQRLRIEGREAVRAMYVCIAPLIDNLAATVESREFRFLTSSDSELGISFSTEYEFPDGLKRAYLSVFLNFDGEKLIGETQYTDWPLTAEFDRMLDDEFYKMPGVTTF